MVTGQGTRRGAAFSFAILLLLLAPLFFLLLSTASAAEVYVYKNVTGEKIVDFGSKIHVFVSVRASEDLKLERLEDPVPEEFSAINYPSSCSFAGSLVCSFGFTGSNLTVEYDLVAVGAGQKVVFLPARMFYKSPEGLEESRSSNEVDGFFYVGRSLVNTTVSLLEVDGGTVLQAFVLPNSRVKIGITARNSGALPADAISVSLNVPAGWSLFSGKTSTTMQTLAAGDSGGFVATLAAPGVKNFAEGSTLVNYTTTWIDAGKPRVYSNIIFIFMQKPSLEIVRKASVKWRRDDTSLEPVLETALSIRNKGSSEASVTIDQEIPATIESSTIPKSLKIGAKKEEKFSAISLVSGEKVVLPAGSVSYTDSLGNSYEPFKFQSEEVKIEKNVWATIYQMTEKYFPTPQIAAGIILLSFIFFLPVISKNSYLLLACGALGLLALLVLASTAIIWFGL